MTLNVFKKLLLVGVFFMPVPSMAWGPTGHRIVGEIAQHYLTVKAKSAIQKILGTESIAIASTWADFIRSDTTFGYLSPWHYLNIKDGFTYSEFQAYLKKDTAADAYTKLNFLIKELKKKQLSADKKLLYLRLLIHITGDIHQPLHVGRAEDMGGNAIKVFWFNEPTNLHRVWDEHLIDFQKLSYTEYVNAINHAKEKQKVAWQKQTVSQWFFESYQFSRQLYGEITQSDQKLSFRYNFDHIETANQQLVKAGVRLAGLLNEIFGK